MVRALNEDSYLSRPDCRLWAVADGLGGHAAGDVASRSAIDALGRIDARAHSGRMLAEIQSSMMQVNAELYSNAMKAIMGTTVVVLLVQDKGFVCVWAGDSRAYTYASGKLTQITSDHSLVQEMVDAGTLDAREARQHPRANVLTRAVGGARELELGWVKGDSLPIDRFLLCSDGLTGMLDDNEIAEMMSLLDVSASADALLQAALSRGAKDNVTLVLRRTKAALIYRKTGNLRAVQLLPGHTKLESTVRYLGVEVDDPIAISEQVDL